MITCTRKIHFCSGHRVYGHESKCANLHGHNYVAWVTAVAPRLDAVGRIVDFSVLKQQVGGWIDEHWDHTTLMWRQDPGHASAALLMENKPLYLCEFNPTAEEMAYFLLKEVCPRVLTGTGVTVTQVRLFETENCYADATIGDER